MAEGETRSHPLHVRASSGTPLEEAKEGFPSLKFTLVNAYFESAVGVAFLHIVDPQFSQGPFVFGELKEHLRRNIQSQL